MTDGELSSTELVVMRLDEHASPEADRLCQVAIEGDRYADRLDYEDWVRPLKLTGGTVCLGVTDADGETFSWYQCRGDELHHHWKASERGVSTWGPQAVSELRNDLWNRPDVSVKPVPVEETPFTVGEGEDPNA